MPNSNQIEPNPITTPSPGEIVSTQAMSPLRSISVCFSKYFDFKNRATRAEYWWFYLFSIIMSFIAAIVDSSGFTTVSVNFLFTIPVFAAGARRLHDINKSGWWQLLWLTGVGGILVIIWQVMPSDRFKNDYDQ